MADQGDFEAELAEFTAGERRRKRRILWIGGIVSIVLGIGLLVVAVIGMLSADRYAYGMTKSLVLSAGLLLSGIAFVRQALRER